MKLTRQDWPHLRGTVFFAAAVLALALGAVGGAHQFKARMQQSYAALQAQVAQAHARLARTQEERKNLDDYYEEYRRLLARGVIGEEQRLDWIETIDRLRGRQQLFGARYTISPQRPFQPEIPLPDGPIDLRASDMRLQLTLLHEGELARFFEALREEANGLFLLRGCQVKRAASGVALRFGPQLEADCQLTWVSLKDRPRP
ncbi:hypothetical protein [Pelomicrobium sp.]|uniref:hypothetical protein n=1 Tax=Pelomicrobium sp. TaxID=2815319 RepID=UPI002FDD7D33